MFALENFLVSYNLISYVRLLFQLLALCPVFVQKSIKRDWNGSAPMFLALRLFRAKNIGAYFLAPISFGADTL